MIARVVNVKHEGYDVFIQRSTKWGNPYYGPGAIELYKEHLKEQFRSGALTVADLAELRGKRLGCGCKPKPCHGDILADLVNRYFKDVQTLDDFV